MAQILFYALSVAAVGFALRVVSSRSPMLSVLALLGSFLSLAILYLLAGFQFIAAAQVLVYAGAIMVLFLFVVMLLNLADLSALRETPLRTLGNPRVALAAAAAGGLALAGLLAAFARPSAQSAPSGSAAPEGGIDQLEPLAAELFSRHVLAFEASSLLLLATMIAVLVLAKRQRPGGAP